MGAGGVGGGREGVPGLLAVAVEQQPATQVVAAGRVERPTELEPGLARGEQRRDALLRFGRARALGLEARRLADRVAEALGEPGGLLGRLARGVGAAGE